MNLGIIQHKMYYMAKSTKTTSLRKPKKRSRSETKRAYTAQVELLHHNYRENVAFAAGPPNFEYTLTVDGVEVQLLDINTTIVSPIMTSGRIYADTGKPFYIEVRAFLNSPTGSGSLQLKDLVKGTNVFAQPQAFSFGNSSKGGLFLKNVKLP